MTGRRLVRSKKNRKIAGVAGGVADYFGIDPTAVRVAWVVAVVLGGVGLVPYIVLWIVLPEGEVTPRAIEIAEERFAKGEITDEELQRIRADLKAEE